MARAGLDLGFSPLSFELLALFLNALALRFVQTAKNCRHLQRVCLIFLVLQVLFVLKLVFGGHVVELPLHVETLDVVRVHDVHDLLVVLQNGESAPAVWVRDREKLIEVVTIEYESVGCVFEGVATLLSSLLDLCLSDLARERPIGAKVVIVSLACLEGRAKCLSF